MPWDIGAGIAGAAGAGAELVGDQIRRDRNLQDAGNLEALKAKVEQDKLDRIAGIVGGVSRTATTTVDDESGGHTVTQPKDEAAYRRERGDALSAKGFINEADREYTRADTHADRVELRTTQAAAQQSADEKWRTSEARQDKVWEETVRHNKALEAKVGADRISPAARTQLEMASVHVSSAQKAEAEAAKSLDAVRKNMAASPDERMQAESEYKSAKVAVKNALAQYDRIGQSHFGDNWATVTDTAAKPEAAAPDTSGVGEIRYKGTTPYKMGPDGRPVPATAADVAAAKARTGGGSKPAAPGIISEPAVPVTPDDWKNVETARAARAAKTESESAARMAEQRKRGEDIDAFNARMKQH